MLKSQNNDLDKKKEWVTPELNVISGLDSCVEFLYGTGGDPIGDNNVFPPGYQPRP